MLWVPKTKMQWVCNDVDGITSEVKIVKGVVSWTAIDTTNGEVVSENIVEHPLDAIKLASSFLDAVVDLRSWKK